jgi:uncharacterized radical SAM protein YgiQ
MLAHYTAFRKKRSEDAYTPGGLAGARPNRACIVYANLLRRAFPGLPVVLGGIEASLRRITHYDFWTDALRKPILLDAKADGVVYGMGERAVVDIARRLDAGQGLAGIPGTVTAPVGAAEIPAADIEFPSHEDILANPKELMRATLLMEKQVHDGTDRAVQRGGERAVVIEPPAERLGTEEMDRRYALPFARRAHPSYGQPVPAIAAAAAAAPSAPWPCTRAGASPRAATPPSKARSDAWPQAPASGGTSPTSAAPAPTCGARSARRKGNPAAGRAA